MLSLVSRGSECARCLRRHGAAGPSRRHASAAAAAVGARPLKVAIIGSGPSGFYTASRILTSMPADSPAGKDVEVHMYERLPTPYGLVRFGVAPDHPEVKNCQHKFDELAADARFKFFGNVSLGTQPSASPSTPSPRTTLSPYTYPHALHLPLSAIRPYYSTLVLTYGASLSNPLSSVLGSSSSSEPLRRVWPALAFVSWYNGHPAFSHLSPDLENVEDVTIVGQGNVALDVGRILLKPVSELADTDIPSEVLEVLARSKVRRVRAVGRRGPGQVAFTTKEFREMLKLPDVSYGGVDPILMNAAKGMVTGDRMKTRLLGLMEKSSESGAKAFELDFLKSPRQFLPKAGEAAAVGGVEWAINALEGDARGGWIAKPTGQTQTSETDMVVESVGYRSEPLLDAAGEWELPFDASRGRVRNVEGRVVDAEGQQVPGVYVAGWAARGPVGVIASTMNDAYGLAAKVMEDHLSLDPSSNVDHLREPESGIPEPVQRGLKDGRVVDLAAWAKIDAAEREVAKRKGGKKEREKFIQVEDMLAVL